MGTIISMMKSKPEIPEMDELSDEDVANIQRTWQVPRAIPLDAGETILLRFFEVYPHYQKKFEHFKNTPLLTLKGAPGFRTHAGRIIKVFDDTIQTLGGKHFENELKGIWETTGRNHYNRTIPMKAFVDLKVIIMDVLKEVCNLTSDEYKSWDRFFNNIYHVMFSTMENVAAENRKR